MKKASRRWRQSWYRDVLPEPGLRTAFDDTFPQAHGAPLAQASLKYYPQDFVVEETLSFPLSGEGEHLYLHVRKTGANTDWVSRQLARQLGVAQRDIGYAGLKDRHAVTSQWFSLPATSITSEKLDALLIDGVEIIETQLHTRKLRRGAIRHNRFTICLRNLRVDPEQLGQRLIQIREQGVPNYYDEQRFGHDRGNLVAACRMFERKIRPSRFQRGLYLSAARAWIFNQILAARIAQHSWNSVVPGDVYWLDGTKRCFGPESEDATLAARLAQGDIHVTGALWGEGEPGSADAVAELETDIAAQWPALSRGLVDARLTQERRALRVMPRELSFDYDPVQGCLSLRFALPAGSYATAVLRELVVTVQADRRN